MHQAKEFVDNHLSNYIWKLKRALYGLKQAARGFYNTLCSAFHQWHLTVLQTDSELYIARTNNKDTWGVAYIDNFLIFKSDKTNAQIIKNF